MPTYQYRCKDCDADLEVVQKFTDDALTDCPECEGGQLRKVYNAVGVVFKGSGFYKTDSRKPGEKSSTTGTKQSTESKSDAGGTAKKESSATPAAGSTK